MKTNEVLYRLSVGRLKVREAAELLGVTERTIRRYRKRCEESGEFGLFDRRCLRPSPKRYPEELRERVRTLYRQEYFDFNVKHFHEKLTEFHKIEVSYTWVKNVLQEAGLISKHRSRGQYRRRRERRPLEGMMLHLDGSQHHWFGDKHPSCDLLVVMDDATSEVFEAKFVPQENTKSCLSILRSVVEKKGVFSTLYTDRASHFVVTKDKKKGPDRTQKTQVERALNQLGTRLICAYSPQARGRSERLFGTWQSRLVPEMRKAGIQTMEQGNAFLGSHFIPWHNRTLKVTAKESGSAFVPTKRKDLERIFAVHHGRIVQKDNTITFERKTFQLPHVEDIGCLAKQNVTLYEHLDGLFTIGWGERTLGCYNRDGKQIASDRPTHRRA